MTITSVSTATFIADTTILIRDDLRDNITDPISTERTGNEQFVMTSYPERNVKYPIISVMLLSVTDPSRLGMQSEIQIVTLPLEIRVWARNFKEKDELSQEVIERLRSNQLDTGGTIEANLHDFIVTSAVSVDESGEGKPKSRVINVEYLFILGAT